MVEPYGAILSWTAAGNGAVMIIEIIYLEDEENDFNSLFIARIRFLTMFTNVL